MLKKALIKAPSFMAVLPKQKGSKAAAEYYTSVLKEVQPEKPLEVIYCDDRELTALRAHALGPGEVIILYDCSAHVAQFSGLHPRLLDVEWPFEPRWMVGVGSQCDVRKSNRRSFCYLIDRAFRPSRFDECARIVAEEKRAILPWGETRAVLRKKKNLQDPFRLQDVDAWFRSSLRG